MHVSNRMIPVIAEEEGVVLKAYRCPAGVLTVGIGHTSRAGAPKVTPGMTVSRARAFDILTTDLARSFEPRVTKVLPGATQNVFDGAASFDFNTGRVHNASWVAALKAGNPAKAEASFRSWNKGGGRLLKGLVRRRGREADIIFRNRYGAGIPAPTGSATERTEEIVACQTALARLGFYTGEIDGRAGPKTVAAVKAFQSSADLTVDGIAGPATRAALHRALVTRLANRTSAAGGIAAGGTDAAIDTALSPNPLPQSEPPPLPDGLIDAVGPAIALGAVAASIWVGFWVWRNRGRLFAWLPEGLKDFIQDRTGIVGGRRVAA